MKNKKGFVYLPFILFVFVLFYMFGIFFMEDISSYRIALADDMRQGKLITTPKALSMIAKGDLFLNVCNEQGKKMSSSKDIRETALVGAFIAKIWFERARLEMEMNNERY